jgi:4-hydroxybutyrate CoA-transferase
MCVCVVPATVNNAAVIVQNPRVVAINTCVQIDLTGQVVSDSVGQRIISGTGGQLDFIRAAGFSPGGKPILALEAQTKTGASRIVACLDAGSGVVTPRADVHYVVTEHGSVNLWGKSLRERARLLISVAAPEQRDALQHAALQRFKFL